MISAETNGVETYYTYGLERISAQTGKTRTEYVYDGRGSVTAEVSYNNAWYTLGGILSSKEVISKSYTPFGEQIGEASSGFGYNGEYYNAATGMVYLRARFYEPEMNRFSQKDVVRGSVVQPGSLNRYSYVQNDPVNFIDPSGQSLKSVWNSVKSAAKNVVTSVKNTASKVVSTVKNVATTVSNAAKSAYNQVKTAVSNVFNGGGNTTSSGVSYTASSTGISHIPIASFGSSSTGAAGSGAYTSSGMATSYYNSNRQVGKTPSPDAPRVEDVSGSDVYYCNRDITTIRTEIAEQLNLQNAFFNVHSPNSGFRAHPNIFDFVYEKVDEMRSTLIKQKELHKNNTGSLVIGVSGAAGAGAEGSFSLGIGIDNDGNIGIVSTGAVGGGLPSLSLSGFISISNAGELQSLDGPSLTTGVSGGELLVGGGEIGIFNDNFKSEDDNISTSITAQLGIGVGIPVEYHAEYSVGDVKSFNIYDVLIKICDMVLESKQ